jgi:hypothetical protein
MVKVLPVELFQAVANEIAIGSAFGALEKSLDISYDMTMFGMSFRYKNLGELLKELREPFSSSSKNY